MASQLESFGGRLRDVFLRIMRQPRRRYLAGIVAALAIHVALRRELDTVMVAVAAIALVVGFACALDVSRAPWAGNLPGVPYGPAEALPVNGEYCQRTAKSGLILLMVGAVVLVPDVVLLVVAVPTALGWALSAVVAVRRAWLVRRLTRALRAYAPTIAIPYAGYSGSTVQIPMWEPYLSESGERGVIFNWRIGYFQKIMDNAHPTWPVVQVAGDRIGDIPRLLVPSLRALFYIHNATENQHYLRHQRVAHVWLGHGDSDKPASYLKRQADYDWLVMAGQAAVDRYAAHDVDVPAEKFKILGRPQTSDIERAELPVADVPRPAVLYAPTWQGKSEEVNFSSLQWGVRLAEALIARNARMIFRPHPLSYQARRYREMVAAVHAVLAADPDGGHIWGPQADSGWGIVQCANASDAMVSDVSSVVSDYLQSGKPYAMFNMRDTLSEFHAEFPLARSAYVISADASNLAEVLEEMLGPDPLSAARAERRDYVLGGFEGRGSAKAFAEFVRDLAHVRATPSY